jgi:hypothetical protein
MLSESVIENSVAVAVVVVDKMAKVDDWIWNATR